MKKSKKPDTVPFLLESSERVYSSADIEEVLELAIGKKQRRKKRNGPYYYNVPACFDIEVSSFYIDNGEVITFEEKLTRQQLEPTYNPLKCACMYVWQFGINGYVIMGRTWQEFIDMCKRIAEYLKLDPETNRLLVYVHNLSYEFQFMCRWFDWYETKDGTEIFAMDNRKVLKCCTTLGIEFRCSYLLSGFGLEKLGDQLVTYPVSKKVGDLDYMKLRHSATILTDDEIGYCVNDVVVVMAYIQEKIEAEKSVTSFVLTKTGEVRRYCRNQCLRVRGGVTNNRYKRTIEELRIGDSGEYMMLKRAFMGGFTHANPIWSGEELHNVHSYDFTSSYPFVMVTETFPMSHGVRVKPKSKSEFEAYMRDFHCVADVRFYNIRSTYIYDQYISRSKCYEYERTVENNGRIVTAEMISTTITDIDYQIIRDTYEWDKMKVGEMICYRRGRLPKEMILSVLKLYENKTKLKGVEGKEVEYMVSKGMLNSTYGMAVTDIVKDRNIFDGERWTLEEAVIAEELERYNYDEGRFTFYPWGIFITAYARRNLWTGILAFGRDYVYSDTDSVKVLHAEQHADYINAYNEKAIHKMAATAKALRIPFELFAPKNVKGKALPMGVWDDEGEYQRFKTLGAKRYMVEREDCINLTVSGVNKKAAVPYLRQQYGSNNAVLDAFADGLMIPWKGTGKMIHTYIDEALKGCFTDYRGDTGYYDERSVVHLEPTSYELGIGEVYKQYLLQLKLDAPRWEKENHG